MTLARITNYVDGNILTGAQLNNEFDNILNNGPSLISLGLPKTTRVQGLHGSLISNIGSFAAMGYSLRSTSGECTISATSSFSVNTQTVGPVANGRDQAAAFASTTVHFYAISTGGNSTVAAGIVSTNGPPTGPTLPAGYSAWAYLASAIYTVATSIVTKTARVTGQRVDFTPANVLTLGAATSAAAIACGATIPANAMSIRARMYNLSEGSTGAGGTVTASYALQPLSTTTIGLMLVTVDKVPETIGGTISAATVHGDLTGYLPLIETTPTLYYSIDVSAGSPGGATMDVDLLGYTVANGDVG